MKKYLAILLAVLMLLTLAACGQESAQNTQTQQVMPTDTLEQDVTTATQQNQSASEEIYKEEKTLEDGSTYVIYRKGGPEGRLTRAEYTAPDGSYNEEIYSEEGKLVSMYYKGTDGTVVESIFYPSGNPEKDIMTYPDGSYDETHYADNGSIDPQTGYIYSGTVTYQVHVTADGKVEELISSVETEEDGTWWETQEQENGTYRVHYGEGWKIIEDISENTAEGYTLTTKYHENGKRKEVTWTYTNSTEYRYTEFYENGVTKVSKHIGADGREINYECDEEGYYTHYYDHDQYGAQEYFAGENHELVKYIENDKVYEGDAISADIVNVFKQMQDMAAEVAYNVINGI